MSSLIEMVEELRRKSERENANESVSYSSGTWTPTFTGFSAAPASPICRYILIGKMCTLFVTMPNFGTSNSVLFTMTAPFQSENVSGIVWGTNWFIGVDNGVTLPASGRLTIGSVTTTIEILKTNAGNTWTTSGTKGVAFVLTYEVP